MALINTERPLSFDKVKGQEEIIKVLKNDLVNGNIKGTYIYAGTRGTGKTSIARIFARALNCEHPNADGSPCNSCKSCKEILDGFSVDVLELDAATYNSVEDVRAIIQKVQYKPFRNYKVVIFDEVQRLSPNAFDALLKTLEEPPKNVVFILCTTEKHKVPATILSRGSCHTFKKMPFDVILSHLEEVLSSKNVAYENAALGLIAKAANGGMRDALSILDNFITLETITADTVAAHLGVTDEDVMFAILNGIADKNPLVAVDAVKKAADKGSSLSFLVEQIFEALLDVAEFQSIGDCDGIIGTESYRDNLIELSVKLSTDKVFQILDDFRKIYQYKNDNLQFSFISAILGLIYKNSRLDEMQSELDALKQKLLRLEQSNITVVEQQRAIDTTNNTPDSVEKVSEPENPSDTEGIMEADYYVAMAGEFDDAGFSYEEEIPSFNEEFSIESATISDKSSTDTTNEFSKMEIPDGISFEELAEMATDISPSVSAKASASSDGKSTAGKMDGVAEDSFFGSFFSEFSGRQP